MKNITYLSLVLNLILVGVIVYLLFRPAKVVNHTITLKDTIKWTELQIVEKTDTLYVNTIDTFYLNNNDTIYLNNLPIEYKVFEDCFETDSTKGNVKIDYHGAFADIDNVDLNYNYTKNIEIPKPKKWGWEVTFGPSIGWGFFPGAPNYGAPFIGISATIGYGYRFK